MSVIRQGAAIAMTAVFALTACTTTHRHGLRSSTRTSSPAAAAPATLLGAKWTLIELRGFGGSASAYPDVANVAFTFVANEGVAPLYAITSGCDTATTSVTVDEIVFHQSWINNLMTNCGPHLRVDQHNWVYGMLSGIDTWSVSNGVLTINKPHVGSLVLRH